MDIGSATARGSSRRSARASRSCTRRRSTASSRAVVIAKADSGITTAADLKGKKIGIPGKYGSSWIMLQALLAVRGPHPRRRRRSSSIPDFGQATALQQGAVDAATGFANNEPIQLKNAGIEPVVLTVDDIVPLPGPGPRDRDRDARRQAGRARGVHRRRRCARWTRSRPTRRSGLDATFALVPDLAAGPGAPAPDPRRDDRDLEEPADGRPTGRSTRAGWQQSLDYMTTLGLVPNPVTVDKLVDESLLGVLTAVAVRRGWPILTIRRVRRRYAPGRSGRSCAAAVSDRVPVATAESGTDEGGAGPMATPMRRGRTRLLFAGMSAMLMLLLATQSTLAAVTWTSPVKSSPSYAYNYGAGARPDDVDRQRDDVPPLAVHVPQHEQPGRVLPPGQRRRDHMGDREAPQPVRRVRRERRDRGGRQVRLRRVPADRLLGALQPAPTAALELRVNTNHGSSTRVGCDEDLGGARPRRAPGDRGQRRRRRTSRTRTPRLATSSSPATSA